MNDRRNKQSEKEKSVKITTPEVIKSEVNLLVYPYFALWDKDAHSRRRIEYQRTVRRGDEKVEIFWKVSSNSDYGFPGPFDRKVFKAIEQIISELKPPIQNPIRIGSLYKLCERMGVSKGGRIYELIKDALIRLKTTTIHTKGTFYSKGRRKWIEDVFSLYERVIFKGEEMPNGKIADDNYIYLNSWYLDNLNAQYVKPIDWEYYRSLRSPIASRLYELLSVKFFGMKMRGGSSISYRYSTLCDLLPLARQRYLSDARKILDPAHEELRRSKFLEGWSWEEIIDERDKDWIITYYPGEKAKSEIRKFNYQLILPEDRSEVREEAGDLTDHQIELIDSLMKLNVSRITAESLVRWYDGDLVEEWIKAIQYVKAKDKAAYIVKAIKENWSLPDEFLRSKEEEEIRTRLEKMEEEERKRTKEEGRRLDEIYGSLSPSEKKQVDEEVERRLPSYIRERFPREKRTGKFSPLTEYTLRAYRREVIKERFLSSDHKP